MGSKTSKLAPEKVTELSQKTRFTSKDIVQWHRGFIKDCPSGVLTKRDFQTIYKQYFPFGDSTKYAHFLFSLLDTDNDGQLTFEEFIVALDISAKGTIDEKLEWSFKLFDLDEDGFVSQPEMLCIVDSIYRMIGDTNGMADDESTPESRVEKVFRMLDVDRDGLLSKREFIDGSKQDPSIIESLNLYAGLL